MLCAVDLASGRRYGRLMPNAPSFEFWFDFSSPYAYFGALQVEEVAARHRRAVTWRPFLLGPVFAATGMQSLSRTPIRGDYARRDWARLARRMRVPFRIPDKHPVVSVTPARAFYWIEQRDSATAIRFARRIFTAYYADGLDMTERPLVLGIAAELGLDTDALNSALDADDLKQVFRARTDEALGRGIFGSPFFIVDGEPFWGADRLAMIDDWLGRGGW